ncbi:hypothetical protein LOS21_11215 [Enterococcus faecium]|nr:hypothetical protein [Enterococcus faecium]
MNGVTFAIYDVSDEFYKLRSEGSSVEDAQRKLAQKVIVKKYWQKM